MSQDYIKIRLSQLRVGVRLRAPIYDGHPGRDQLLLAEGVQLTTGQLELLQRRGITHVLVHRGDLEESPAVSADGAADTAVTIAPGENRS